MKKIKIIFLFSIVRERHKITEPSGLYDIRPAFCRPKGSINIFKIKRWAQNKQTEAAVRKAINDHLYTELPYLSFQEEDIKVKTELLFDFFEGRYGQGMNA